MRGRHRVGAERTAALVRPHRRVDPRLVEEALHERPQLAGERAVGVEHGLLRARPLDVLLLLRDGRHPVVVGELVEPQQPRLQAVPAARQLVARADRRDQRLDRLVRRLVGEIAAGEPVRVVAQAVVDHLVGEQGVEHVAARAQAGLERRGHALGGVAADVAVGREQPRERDLERDGLVGVLELDGDAGGLLLEQPRPRRAAGERLLGEDLLLRLGEQVRPVAAGGAQVVAGEVEPVGGQQLLGALVVEGRPLELEEQQRGLDPGRALLQLLEQRAAHGIGGVEREAQHRVGAGAAEQVLDRLELVHGGHEPGTVDLGDLAGVGGGERVGALLRLGHHPGDRRVGVVRPSVEQRLEVPGDGLEVGIGDVWRGHAPHDRTPVRCAACRRRRRRAGRRA